MPDLIEDVRMTVITAEAVECEQAVFNVKSVRALLTEYENATKLCAIYYRRLQEGEEAPF